jgi:transposase
VSPEAHIAALEAQHAALQAQNKELLALVAQLTHQLAELKRLVFGTRSERFEPAGGPEQMGLFGDGHPALPPPAEQVVIPEQVVTRSAPKQKPVRQGLPAHLPREVIVIEPPVDTAGLRKIGDEVSESLDYRPATLVVIRRERPKYVDPRNEEAGVIIADMPARPIEKGIAEPALLAHVVIEKYVDHLPIYRQVQRFKREGIALPESTIGGWIGASADLLAPLYDALAAEARGSGYIQADETPIQVQDPGKQGKTHRGYYWVYHAPLSGLVVMDYREGRSRDGPAAWLGGFHGALQSDGYAAYEAFDQLPAMTTYGCWAHARRYFFEAKDSSPDEAAYALAEIGKLYEIERALRDERAAAEERRAARQEYAVPVLDALKAWLESQRALPKSPLGKAVGYALNHWVRLVRYAEDGRIEIDNNLVENAIRPIALGRKNYLFAGSHGAARRAAVIYSLLATCKKHDVNPQAWLADVLARIPTHPARQVSDLLPHRWERKG